MSDVLLDISSICHELLHHNMSKNVTIFSPNLPVCSQHLSPLACQKPGRAPGASPVRAEWSLNPTGLSLNSLMSQPNHCWLWRAPPISYPLPPPFYYCHSPPSDPVITQHPGCVEDPRLTLAPKDPHLSGFISDRPVRPLNTSTVPCGSHLEHPSSTFLLHLLHWSDPVVFPGSTPSLCKPNPLSCVF